MIFFLKDIVDSALELSAKLLFPLDKYQLKNWVENSVFAFQHIGLKKVLLKWFPQMTKLALLHIAVQAHYKSYFTTKYFKSFSHFYYTLMVYGFNTIHVI